MTCHRRTFLRRTTVAALAPTLLSPPVAGGPRRSQFRLWVISDAHVGTDRRHGRDSLAEAIRQSEGAYVAAPGFDWDIALHLGDLSGTQGAPTDEEGREVVRQFGAARQHGRCDFYNLAGNHDASTPGQATQWWFRKWVDPTGEQSQFSGVQATERKYPVVGTWERYAIRIGNLHILMMSDRNDLGPPVGRGPRGGYPAGAVTEQTFDWWKNLVQQHREAIVFSAHHHMLKATTVGSGPWEGFIKRADGTYQSKYHGYFPDGAPQGAGYLYWLDRTPDAQAFERYLAEHPAAIDAWLGAHTHTHPDDVVNGRSHVERKWGVHFVNCAALTQYHGRQSVPMSRLFTFTAGSATARVQCYLHSDKHARRGWYPRAERTLELRRPFEW